MKKIFAKLTEKEVEQLAKETYSEVKDVILFMTDKNDLKKFFEAKDFFV